MPLLLVLGCFDGKWPPFAADVTLELYEVADDNVWSVIPLLIVGA
jgi:lysophosphatidic acid phosphatase type 6